MNLRVEVARGIFEGLSVSGNRSLEDQQGLNPLHNPNELTASLDSFLIGALPKSTLQGFRVQGLGFGAWTLEATSTSCGWKVLGVFCV